MTPTALTGLEPAPPAPAATPPVHLSRAGQIALATAGVLASLATVVSGLLYGLTDSHPIAGAALGCSAGGLLLTLAAALTLDGRGGDRHGR